MTTLAEGGLPAAGAGAADSAGKEAAAAAVVAPASVVGEFHGIFKLAWPQSLSFLLSMLSQQINTVFIGRLGPRELGASALALMFCNVTGFSIVYGGLTGESAAQTAKLPNLPKRPNCRGCCCSLSSKQRRCK